MRMNYRDVEQLLGTGHRDEVRAIPPAEWPAILREFFDANTPDERVNGDKLMSMGGRLSRIGRTGLDRIAIQWLADQPDANRLDVTAAFLAGHWGPSSGLAFVDPATVERLVELRRQIESPSPSAQVGCAFALAAAYRRLPEGDARIRLRWVLEDLPRQPMDSALALH